MNTHVNMRHVQFFLLKLIKGLIQPDARQDNI